MSLDNIGNTLGEDVVDPLDEYQELYSENGKVDEFNTVNTAKEVVKTPKRKGTSMIREIIKMAITIILIWGTFSCLFINARIPSESMEPTLDVGDRLLGWRLFSDINRGDIIIFHSPDDNKLLIKRVIGLPGDRVDIERGFVKINGEELDEPWLPFDTVGQTLSEGKTYYGYVPDNCYFVLGDNRTNSFDSRYFEATWVKRESVVAKALVRYYPFNKIGTFNYNKEK